MPKLASKVNASTRFSSAVPFLPKMRTVMSIGVRRATPCPITVTTGGSHAVIGAT